MARLGRILTLCLRGAAAVLAAALLVVAALYVWLAAQDPNGWRPELEAAVQRATGRTVAVEGAVTVGGLLPPTLSAEKITFANAAWGSEPEMARIARVEVTVDLLPLLRGRLQIATLSLAGVELLLETDGSGEGNWRFEPRPDDDADAPPPLPRRIEVRDAVIAWQDGASGMRIGGRIDRLSLAAASPEAPAQLRLEGLMNERPLRLTGAVGPLVSLFRGQDLTFDLEADTADAHARLAGRLSGRSDAMPVALDVQAAVERLDVLEPWLGRGLARDLPARATAELHFARGVVHVDRFDVTAGDSRAEGRLVVRLDGSRPHVAGAESESTSYTRQLQPGGHTAISSTLNVRTGTVCHHVRTWSPSRIVKLLRAKRGTRERYTEHIISSMGKLLVSIWRGCLTGQGKGTSLGVGHGPRQEGSYRSSDFSRVCGCSPHSGGVTSSGIGPPLLGRGN